MEVQGFGAKLKELRQWARMTQKELADKVGIDFTYLSKIENGVMPPPSEKVILKLAEVLNTDKDELLILAGKIPSDIAQVLKNGKTLQRLRSERAKQMARSSNEKRGDLTMVNKILHSKSLSKVAIAFVLVLAVVGSLWFAAPGPVKALDISFPSLPSGTLGSSHTFTITVAIPNPELVPVQSIDLEIYNVNDPSKKVTCANLPLNDGGTANYSGASGTVNLAATAANWAYFAGTGYAIWQGGGYNFGPTHGYGYQFAGIASITYAGTWISPAGWPGGAYKAKVTITATSPTLNETFIQTSNAFTLAVASVGGGGAPPGPPPPGVTDVSNDVDEAGVFISDVDVQSEDGNVTISIETGIQGLTAEKAPIQQISIQPMADPPAPPADSNAIGLTYDFGPDGATFSDPIEVALIIDLDELPAGVDPANLYIARYNEATGEWEKLPTSWDPVTNTLTAEIDHFTAFAVLADARPAAFSASALVITPPQVNIGERVTINATVTNTGDLTGSYTVTCKIDNVVIDTKEITLSGGYSKSVFFITTMDKAGTYTVTVEGLTGTFVVKPVPETPVTPEPPVPPAPAAFEVSQLSISPAEVQVGEEVIVSATVANTGEVDGSYTVTLKVDGVTESTKNVTVAGGQSTKVTFSVVKDVAASYQVDIAGQTGSFTVAKAPLAWWIWLIVGLVVVAAGVGVFIWRRRAYY